MTGGPHLSSAAGAGGAKRAGDGSVGRLGQHRAARRTGPERRAGPRLLAAAGLEMERSRVGEKNEFEQTEMGSNN
jgi:hypothetical protein